MDKNEKAITSGTFPKISVLKQYNKKSQKDFEGLLESRGIKGKDYHNIKSMLIKKDLIVSKEIVLINIGNCEKNNELDKPKLIQLIRSACLFSNKVSIYGWNALMIGLKIQYGSRKCLELTKEIKNFLINHGNAFLEATERPGFLTIVKAPEDLLKERYDYLICRNPKEETSSYFGMWCLHNGTYYIYDNFFEALLNYGYTKEQVRGVIHRCSQSNKHDLIPFYLRKKYLVNPNATKDMRNLLLGETDG